MSLAGTSMSSPILGSVVFNLTFLNEVSRRHETIKDIHAQVIDSCIAVIISRPLIRANHLVQKIPLYFDETPRSKPDQSQPVVPVTTQGYSDTLCLLSVLRTDHPHVPQERRRPHVEPFAAHPLTDGTSLILRDALLDAMEDDDDIERPEIHSTVPTERSPNRQMNY